MLLLYKTPYNNTVHTNKQNLLEREIVTCVFHWNTLRHSQQHKM